MATIEQVTQSSLEYFGGDELPANIFATKYALADNEGNILEDTPDQMHWRLAKEFARIEQKYDNPMSEIEIYNLFKDFKKIIPQGSPMSGIGNPYHLQSLSNCFVIEAPHDSYGGILKTDQELVQIAKRRGGVGTDLSTLRPKGQLTLNAAKTTDGIEVFMDRLSNSCREVAQNGRRGALMICLSVHHPQILDFIRIKKNLGRVTGANISIRLTNEFLNAVENKEDYQLRFPVDSEDPEISEFINANEVWDEIIESAHASAEPGLLFWDNIIEQSPADIYSAFGFKTVGTNPCAELPLASDDSCRLMVLNLFWFVKDQYLDTAYFDYDEFAKVAQKAMRLMDDLIDLELEQVDKILAKIESDPEPDEIKAPEKNLWLRIRKKAENGRRTGLGVTAVGDTVAALGIKYGSEESVKVIETFYKELAINAYKSSSILAKERGAFPIHDYALEKGHPFLERIWEADPEIREMTIKHGRRNIALLTTAPGGSISAEAQVTSGMEPTIFIKYTRRKKINSEDEKARVDFIDPVGDKWTEFDVYHHGLLRWMEATGKTHDDIEESPYWGATANEINWVNKVKIQSRAQYWVDHAISNTTNLPEDVSVDVVRNVYEAAWKSGCKGVTVYREGSRTGVIIQKSDKKASSSLFEVNNAPKRPLEIPCDIHQVTIKGEEWTVLVGLMEGKPYELMGGLSKFVEIPKKQKTGILIKKERKTMASIYDLSIGEDEDAFKIKNVVSAFENPNHSAFTRILSLSLRHGAPIHYIVEQLQKGDKDMDLFSFSKVIGRTLKKYITDGTKPGGPTDCQECGATDSLRYTEGCSVCLSCGSGQCG